MKYKANYEANKGIIYKLAWHFHRSTGLDYNDLVSVGNVAYCTARDGYVDDRGAKFSSFLYTCAKNAMSRFTKLEYREKCPDLDEAFNAQVQPNIRALIFHDNVKSLSKEARQVLALLFIAGEEAFGLTDEIMREHPFKQRKHIKHALAKKAGWSGYRIKNTMKEIREFVKTNI